MDLVELEVRELLERLQLDDVGQVQAVDLLAGQRTDLGGGVVAEIDVLERVEVRAAAPVAGLRLEDLLPPDLVLDHREGAGAVGADLELAVLGRVQHEQRVVEEVLGNRELRGPAVQPHGEVVDLLDGVGVPEAGGLLRVALVVLLAGLVLLEDEPLHEADRGRSRLGVEDALEVPDGVVGRERPAAVPLDVAPDAERPRLEVGAGLPLLDQAGPRDVVHARDGQVVAHLPRGVRRLDPAVGVGALEILAPHAEPESPALRRRLGLGDRQRAAPR